MSEEFSESKEVSQKSPFAGCAILITAVLVMLFLVGFSLFVLFKQFDAISKFTDEGPVEIKIKSLENRESDLNQLAEEIEIFRMGVVDDETAILELDSEELNLSIAAYDAFKDLRGMLKVREIKEDHMLLDISFRLNGKPRLAKEGEQGIIGSDPRYLNGTLVAEPRLRDGEVVLQLSDIEVEGSHVPSEFIQQMSPYRIAERYSGSGPIGEMMAKLTSVELGDGVIRFQREAGKVPADTVTEEQVDAAAGRFFTFLGIAASIFLFFVAIILFVGLRLKKGRNEAV
ncbi:MAG: hypothetical protein AB8D78_11200 [Akkermansiaceae bacterium]